MQLSRPAKGYYSENEAAQALSLSLDQFRALVRQHILQTEDDASNLPMTSFQPADILLLRFLIGQESHARVMAHS